MLLQNPWFFAGWLICIAVILYGLVAAWTVFRRRSLLLRQFAKEDLVLEAELQLLRERREREIQSSDGWEGFANFVVVRKVLHGGSGICSFYLKPKDERLELAPFLPGQHLVFQLPVAGQSQPITRRYSLSDRPGIDHYRVSIKLAPSPADQPELPAGLGSSYFHQELEEECNSPYSCLIQVSSPAGSFLLNPQESKPVVLIGGGVGITPMLSMFNSIIEENDSREAWLFYSIRNANENVLLDEGMLHPKYASLAASRENLHLHLYYSREQVQSPSDFVDSHHGRLTVDALKEQLPSNNYRFYICGPDAMMDQFEEELEAWGVPEEDILSERFAPPKRKQPVEGMVERTIQFARSKKEIQFTAEDGSILEAAQRAGVPIAFDCRAGSCGQCKVGVVSGKVGNTIRTNYKCPPGSCLTCSCAPESDIILDC